MKLSIRGAAAIIAIAAGLSGCVSNPNNDAGPRPPSGVGAGGTDFGTWHRDGDGSVDQAFRTFIMGRYSGADGAKARTDLTTDGFACRDVAAQGQRPAEMSCVRSYYQNDFYHVWQVEFLAGASEPKARYTRTATRNPLSDTGPRRNRQPPAQ